MDWTLKPYEEATTVCEGVWREAEICRGLRVGKRFCGCGASVLGDRLYVIFPCERPGHVAPRSDVCQSSDALRGLGCLQGTGHE